ncbi:26S proteasome subunit P45 [Carpediemonas membranifera]|uniref:26S proteasome subunit P45 n=1 Tax=Carpediemonas membranifera TaxID=201153 RepID=A0A8J6B5G2_9EUKA|nr:26S proteasome subunit P45 [Carpediemonas membranifera]|eukprot:KAG9394684.1 26S proteasome subunit P45 [Carpediemonas membranifera]
MANREELIQSYLDAARDHEAASERLKQIRKEKSELDRDYQLSEMHINALQSVGQLIGEILRKIDDDQYIVKATHGQKYLVNARKKVEAELLREGTRVALDMQTYTIMRALPREVDPTVFHMLHEDPGDIQYDQIGGLDEQLEQVREVIDLPLSEPELFKNVGIRPPKGVLLYGPPGTGKTLIARALAHNVKANFLKIVASSIIQKYIGESPRIIREIFAYAKEHEPAIVFIDEIDAIGGRRLSDGTSTDREVQRTLMELLNQLDGFDDLGQVKVVFATNRPDILDPALLRPGRLDRKIEIGLPNEAGRKHILAIHSSKMHLAPGIDWAPIVKASDGFNGADLRNVCTEAGMCAIRDERGVIEQGDLLKAVRKLGDSKKLETALKYEKV